MGWRLRKSKRRLRREAAKWLVRRQSGSDPNIERNFSAWYRADPSHAIAFDRIEDSYRKAGLLRQSTMASPVSPANHAAEVAPAHRRFALAAAVAGILLVPGAMLIGGIGPFGHTEAALLSTREGESRNVLLADGSRIVLGSATKVEVDVASKRRRAELRQGRARFEIAAGTSPMTIEAGAAVVTANTAVVDVERSGDTGRVSVVGGEVSLASAGVTASALALTAGEGGTASPGKAPLRSNAGAADDRTSSMLQFDGTPLSSAVELANRDSDRRIRLSGDVAGLRVTGAFRAGDADGLARALAAAFRLSLRASAAGEIVLSRQPDPSPERKNGR